MNLSIGNVLPALTHHIGEVVFGHIGQAASWNQFFFENGSNKASARRCVASSSWAVD